MAKEDNVTELPKGGTILVVPVPLEIYQELVEALEELPRKRTKLLWNHLQQLQPQEAKVQQ